MVKLLEENIGKNLYDVGLGSDFLHMSPKTEETKIKINSFFKLKCFCSEKKKKAKQKQIISKMKRQSIGGNICKLCI